MTNTAPDVQVEQKPEWGYAKTVGNLIAQLRTMDPDMPIYGGYHVIREGKPTLHKVKGLTISRERVIDGHKIDSSRTDVPYSYVAWTHEQSPVAGDAVEAVARIREAVDRRESGLQSDRNHSARSCDKWDEKRIAEERAYAHVPHIRLDDLQALLAALQAAQPGGGVEVAFKADREELLSEALFALSDRLRASGFLTDDKNHAAYEAVVKAFSLPAQSPVEAVKAVFAVLWKHQCYNGVKLADIDDYRIGARLDMGGHVEKYEAEAAEIVAAIAAQPGGNVVAEREACAKVADERVNEKSAHPEWNLACWEIAASIRARATSGVRS